MVLTAGTRLGPYEIVAPLGAGGMGEVFRARDTRLGRDVAIKVLPASLASDPSLRQRFEREAKTVSQLAHPHICMLYDAGHQDGLDFLVMELVEGETAERRLLRGALPLDQTLRIAVQVADALAEAHKLGIVHRDLKASNIMLTKTGAKLMDFGLAKQFAPAPLRASPTKETEENLKLTVEGAIIGTFQYMAPEQLEGKEADARTDIFALGELIYEMATGKPAFAGKSRASLIATILSSEPQPMTALQPMTPSALERVVKKCLAKDPDQRWQSASDLASELRWIAEGGSQPAAAGPVPTSRRIRDRAGWLVAATLLVMFGIVGTAWWAAKSKLAPTMAFSTPMSFPASTVALSLSGRTLATVAYSEQLNNYVIWTYEVGSQRSSWLDGTQGASYPFWSPDGKSIGFFADGKLKRVEASGGQVRVLCDAPNGRGGDWNRDGIVLFAPDAFGGLYRVSSSGGPAAEVTTVDRSRFETTHRWPVFLPDGNHFLYLAANFTGQMGTNTVFLGSLDSKERRPVLNTNANVAYAEPGYLLYLRDWTLVAQRFDWRRNALSGEPHAFSGETLYSSHVDWAAFAAGKDVLVTKSGTGATSSRLTWFDRSGKPTDTNVKPGWYNNVRLSPNGSSVAVDQTDQDGRHIAIWVYALTQDATRRLTFDLSLNQLPAWSSDGKRVLYSSNRNIRIHLYEKNADGSGAEREVADLGVENASLWDWSPDGNHVLINKGTELWDLSVPDGKAKPMLQAKWAVKNAQFSPDGHWIAYSSNETGAWEIYVCSFPNASGKWQVSRGGGQEPRWRRDGKELFYLSADGKMMAASVKASTSFESGSPITLFQTRMRQPVSSAVAFSYDVSGDGKRFLIATKLDEANAAPFSILLNWASEIEK